MESMAATLDEFQRRRDTDLDEACSHGCAMGGDVRRLLVHNLEHDRMHAGAISNARFDHRQLQESELARLLRDWLRERVELVGQLIGAPDEVLELKAKNDEWSVRQHVEHVLHWERDTTHFALQEAAERAGQPAPQQS